MHHDIISKCLQGLPHRGVHALPRLLLIVCVFARMSIKKIGGWLTGEWIFQWFIAWEIHLPSRLTIPAEATEHSREHMCARVPVFLLLSLSLSFLFFFFVNVWASVAGCMIRKCMRDPYFAQTGKQTLLKTLKNNAKNTSEGCGALAYTEIRSRSLICSPTLSLSHSHSHPHTPHARRLMHRDIAKHAHTRSHRSSLAQQKTRLLKRCAASSVHWPLVVNNDMTHPAERLLFTWAWWGRTGVHGVRQPGSPLPPEKALGTADFRCYELTVMLFISFSDCFYFFPPYHKQETSQWPWQILFVIRTSLWSVGNNKFLLNSLGWRAWKWHP